MKHKANTCNRSIWNEGMRQEDCHKFQVSLGYLLHAWLAWATETEVGLRDRS